MKIYTKTGDKGTTSLYGGTKVSKADLRIESYGTTDELNSAIGCIMAHTQKEDVHNALISIQKQLFVLGAELATPPDKLFLANGKSRIGKTLQEEDITALENHIDQMESELPALQKFILPGGGAAAAHAHLARTICRRAERRVVALKNEDEVRKLLVIYLNRLSDYLFVLARKLSKDAGIPDTEWLPEA
ncbi:MAG: cob(I)yrinic acid a,c-diamide adenosyltransferase [Weeksellaceae bacterium]|nr:cob(I)yrinic acid a,c-diamide adenosyltransferase [Weeksellaceae bacterium]